MCVEGGGQYLEQSTKKYTCMQYESIKCCHYWQGNSFLVYFHDHITTVYSLAGVLHLHKILALGGLFVCCDGVTQGGTCVFIMAVAIPKQNSTWTCNVVVALEILGTGRFIVVV